MSKKRLDLWLPSFFLEAAPRARGRQRRRRELTHILFLVCDHFEPRHGIGREEQAVERLQAWHEGYAALQARCRARFGTAPLHTWFYPPHHGIGYLSQLSDMVFDGLGEVELHYHHDGDTPETLRRALSGTVSDYHRWGHLLQAGEQPRSAFGFIHGDWALNNARGGKFCGVNDEVSLLQDLGCWGDFTMPSGEICQTRKVNSIYYGLGDPDRPKAHDWGVDAEVGHVDPPGLFMMQGPLAINWWAPGYPRVENASLTSENWGRPDRIRQWLDCNVHVHGKPDWQFVKLHAHGAIERDFDALFGDKAFETHRILNEEFNDGERYRLHYVTAREAYNIAKAAEHGKTGDPSEWRNYVVGRQPHAFYALDAPHDLLRCEDQHLHIERIGEGHSVRLRSRVGPLRAVCADLESVEVNDQLGTARLELRADAGEVLLELGPGCELGPLEGGTLSALTPNDSGATARLLVGRKCLVRYRRAGNSDGH